MITVFEHIPDIFLERYDMAFRTWASEFRKRGHRCAIPFDRLPGEPALLDDAGRPVLKGCWLEAQVEDTIRGRHMVVRPASDHDRLMVERHSHDLRRFMLQ